jgi:hypothetical protein
MPSPLDSPPILAPLSDAERLVYGDQCCDICFDARCTRKVTQARFSEQLANDPSAADSYWVSVIYVCEPCGVRVTVAPNANAN